MVRLVLAVDPDVGVDSAAMVEAWSRDKAAGGLGSAGVEAQGAGGFLPGPVELVVVPLVVNVAASVVYDVARRVVGRLRGAGGVEELEFIEHSSGEDRVLVVRVRRSRG
jgi:hypothetical protein